MGADRPEDSKKDNNSNRDIDGGWAWLVLIAVLYWNMVLGGTVKCFGILYVEFLDLYEEGPTKTSWIMASFGLALIFPGMVTGYISDHRNTRTMNMVLTFLVGLSFAATAFAPDLTTTIITHGLLAGALAGSVDAPFLGTVNKYFNKRRDFAFGIVFSGGSIGSLTLPHLLTWAVEEYTVRGTMFIVASLWMQGVAVAAVLRTLPMKSSRQRKRLQCMARSKLSLIPVTVSLDPSPADIAWSSPGEGNGTSYLKRNTPRDQAYCVDKQVSATPRREPMQESRNQGEQSQRTSLKATLRDYFTVLKSVPLLLVLLAGILNAVAFYSQLNVWPAHVEEIGMTKNDAALLLAIEGFSEIVSRPLVGFLCSKFHLNKPILLAVFGFTATVIGIPVSFSKTKWLWCLHAFLFGIFGGMFVALTVPVMIDVSSSQRGGSVSASFVLAIGFGIAIGPPVLGAIKEAMGLYVYSIRFCLLLYIPAGILLMLSVMIHRCCSKKETVSSKTESTRL